jgi:hypothetical protein
MHTLDIILKEAMAEWGVGVGFGALSQPTETVDQESSAGETNHYFLPLACGFFKA